MLLASTMLTLAAPALAQQAQVIPEPSPRNVAPETPGGIVRSIEVRGAERVEPATVLVYVELQAGARYDRETLDAVRPALQASTLMIVGAQTIFSSFFLSMLAVPRRDG